MNVISRQPRAIGGLSRAVLAVFIAWGMNSAVSAFAGASSGGEHALVLQSDFGLKDGAAGAMRGVAVEVSRRIPIHDLSHENTPFNIWEAAYRLKQAAPYWPEGTVFVSVVDPGVGSERKAIVLQTKSGHYFVGPDNGTFSLIAEDLGIAAVRAIDEKKHRRRGSDRSHTFHGRDVFAFVGARLAAEKISFADVGPLLDPWVVTIEYKRAHFDGTAIIGSIPLLDARYGNVWTNIGIALFEKLEPQYGERFHVRITCGDRAVFAGELPYVRTFADVSAGAPLLYLNSLLSVALALNMDDFAKKHSISSGADWIVRLERSSR